MLETFPGTCLLNQMRLKVVDAGEALNVHVSKVMRANTKTVPKFVKFLLAAYVHTQIGE